MDKSRRYIRLCDRADEIQRLWHQSYGDFYLDEKDRITCWIGEPGQVKRFKKGFAISAEGDVIRLAKHVWLPRQNQLIEIAQVRGRTYDSVVLDFYNWTKTGYDTRSRLPGKLFPSMEQIWMGYVMHRKFGKKWIDSCWKKIG